MVNRDAPCCLYIRTILTPFSKFIGEKYIMANENISILILKYGLPPARKDDVLTTGLFLTAYGICREIAPLLADWGEGQR